MIRDRLVFGCLDQDARRRVFREPDITLEKAVELLRVSEVSKEQLKKMGFDKELHSMKKLRKPEAKKDVKPKFKPTGEKAKEKAEPRKCRFCNTSHVFAKLKCPAWGKQCSVCKKPNHLPGSSVCKGATTTERKNLHAATAAGDSDDDYIYSVKSKKSSQFLVALKYHVGKAKVVQQVTQLDTGATCSAMSYDTLRQLLQREEVQLGPPSGKISLYDSRYSIEPMGTYKLKVQLGDEEPHEVVFDIVPNSPWPILSDDICSTLGWIKLSLPDSIHGLQKVSSAGAEAIINEYEDIFNDELGCIGTYHIDIDPEITPVQHAPRRVPVALRARVKDKLDELEARGIIAKVTEPTEWISSSVVVDKP
jgi:hypothetical protein